MMLNQALSNPQLGTKTVPFNPTGSVTITNVHSFDRRGLASEKFTGGIDVIHRAAI